MITTLVYANPYGYITQEERRESAKVLEPRRKLENLDIVRNASERWDEEDYITRRDMLKMLHIVKGHIYDKNLGRKYICHTDPNKSLYLFENEEEIEEFIELMKESEFIEFDYTDLIPGTDDYYFAFSLTYLRLINGIEKEDGKRYIEFDRKATIGEAITSVCRLFDSPAQRYFFHNPYSGEYISYDADEKSFYDYAEKLNLINSDTMFDVLSLNIEFEDWNNKIKAYDFMCLLYKALYVSFPASQGSWYSEAMFHYIDILTEHGLNIMSGPPVTEPSEYEAIVD